MMPLVGQHIHGHRIPASRVVTTAIRPSASRRDTKEDTANPNFWKVEYFDAKGLTGVHAGDPSGKSLCGAHEVVPFTNSKILRRRLQHPLFLSTARLPPGGKMTQKGQFRT
jgi:hypothetical protein